VLEEPAAQAMRHAIWVCLQLGGPPLLAMLLVGVVISLIQTVTQIQESTLTFVPKVLAMLITLALAMPFMLQTLTDFTHKLHDKIVNIE
jgi:flagellar biosynthetic protein FliQ